MTEQIANDVPMPEASKPRSRARKSAAGVKKDKTPSPAASLLAALKFISVIQKKVGPANLQFCNIAKNWAVAFDGVIMIGHKIEEDLEACPNTLAFIDALTKVKGEFSITQLNANVISVASNVFRALVSCAHEEEVSLFGNAPDNCIATVDDSIKAGFLAVAPLVNETSPNVANTAILLQANTIAATNGHMLMEYWHGIDLPPGLLIPKAAAMAVAKASQKLTGFGYSMNSVTFWFENGAFIKTGLYAERFPEYGGVFALNGAPQWMVPEEFFIGIKAIESFTQENNSIYFEGDSIYSAASRDLASTYKIEGLPERCGFNAKYLLLCEEFFKEAYFVKTDFGMKVVFFGGPVRGAVMGLKLAEKEQYSPKPMPTNAPKYGGTFDDMNDWDDDIPF